MTYSEAATLVKNSTGLELLEALETLHEGDTLEFYPQNVSDAYIVLMTGFAQMFGGAA